MKRFFVEQVKTAMEEPQGPFPQTITVEAKVKDGDEEYYVSLVELEGGGADLYKTTESKIKELTFSTDEDTVEMMQKALVASCDYSEVFAHTDWEWLPLFRYLTYILRADQNLFDSYNNRVINKYVDEIDFPASDVEQENTPM
jgi:hypothetical protein